MSTKVTQKRAGVASALLACGTAGLFAVTACSSGSGSSSAAASAPSTAASASAAAAEASSTGSSSTGSSSTGPSWAAALGSSVTVVPPAPATPGHGSPAAVVSGVLKAIGDKSVSGYCGYAEPSTQKQCNSELSQLSPSQLPSDKNAALGYIAVEGDKAVAGMTGTLCPSGTTDCGSNSDPAALFTTLHTFSALWQNAISNSGSKYSLTPLIKLNGSWYIYATS